MKAVIIILLLFFYLVNTRIYISLYSKLLKNKYTKKLLYNSLWIIFWAIIIIKQFSSIILKNQILVACFAIFMLVFQFAIVFCFYLGTIKQKLISTCILCTVSTFLDIFAVAICFCFGVKDMNLLLNTNTVIISGSETILTILTYVAFIFIKNKIDSKKIINLTNQIFVTAVAILCLVVPCLIIFNTVSLSEQNLKIISYIQFFLIIYIIIFSYFKLTNNKLKVYEAEYNNQILHKEIEYYNNIYESINELHKLRHDMNNHYNSLLALINLEKYDMAKDYLEDICSHIQKSDDICILKDKLLNIILTDKFRKAAQNNIKVQHMIIINTMSEQFLGSFKDIDKTALFSNMMDNAIRAAKNSEAKEIKLDISSDDKQLTITCENSRNNELLQSSTSGTFKSTKHKKGHGLGMRIIQETVRKYHGTVAITLGDKVFITDIKFDLRR